MILRRNSNKEMILKLIKVEPHSLQCLSVEIGSLAKMLEVPKLFFSVNLILGLPKNYAKNTNSQVFRNVTES